MRQCAVCRLVQQGEPLILGYICISIYNFDWSVLNAKWAGGGVLSNCVDLLKFGNIMLACYQLQDNDSVTPFIRSQTVQQLLWAPQTLHVKSAISPANSFEKLTNGQASNDTIAYGLGWFLCIDKLSGALKYVVSLLWKARVIVCFETVIFVYYPSFIREVLWAALHVL